MSTLAAPQTSTEKIGELRAEVDAVDLEIIRLVQRRHQISQEIGAVRAGDGGTRLSLSRESQILRRYQEALGAEGATLALLLLRQGRGQL